MNTPTGIVYLSLTGLATALKRLDKYMADGNIAQKYLDFNDVNVKQGTLKAYAYHRASRFPIKEINDLLEVILVTADIQLIGPNGKVSKDITNYLSQEGYAVTKSQESMVNTWLQGRITGQHFSFVFG